jgi:hypothetical protein
MARLVAAPCVVPIQGPLARSGPRSVAVSEARCANDGDEDSDE